VRRRAIRRNGARSRRFPGSSPSSSSRGSISSSWPNGFQPSGSTATERDGSGRSGRRAFHHARAAPNADAIHEWRKRVKDLWYVAQIIAPVWPEMLEERATMLRHLARLLGDHHDIWALDAYVAENRRRCGGIAALRVAAVAERRMAEIESEIFERGAAAYAEPSRDWNRNIVDSWRAWTMAEVM
jgi:CHAD domain-containing protein